VRGVDFEISGPRPMCLWEKRSISFALWGLRFLLGRFITDPSGDAGRRAGFYRTGPGGRGFGLHFTPSGVQSIVRNKTIG